MSFFIKDENVRPGNRGGRDQFKWDNIRLLNNKDRESYLGVTQSIGFLDKGGKWRKRDWWLTNSQESLDAEVVQREKEALRKEEERQMKESLFPGLKEKNQKAAVNNTTSNNQIKAKLTDYEWKELMKKEANFKPDDSQLFEFYENDDKRAGIGMKSSVSFRTNPYTEKNLTKLEGMNIENNESDDKNDKNEEISDNPYISTNEKQEKKNEKKNTLVDKYIREHVKEKREKAVLEKDKNNKNEDFKEKEKEKEKDKSKKKHKHKSRSRSRSRNRSEKKHKKSKK